MSAAELDDIDSESDEDWSDGQDQQHGWEFPQAPAFAVHESQKYPPTMLTMHHPLTGQVLQGAETPTATPKVGGGAKVAGENRIAWSKFTRSLFAMANAAENEIGVGFSADGTLLEIRDVKRLQEDILPKYFRHNNVSSFVRQLNNYGFKTMPSPTSNSTIQSFYHDFFRKDRLDLLSNVVRKPNLRKSRASKKQNLETSDNLLSEVRILKQRELEYRGRIQQLEEQNHQLLVENTALRDENNRLRMSSGAWQHGNLPPNTFERLSPVCSPSGTLESSPSLPLGLSFTVGIPDPPMMTSFVPHTAVDARSHHQQQYEQLARDGWRNQFPPMYNDQSDAGRNFQAPPSSASTGRRYRTLNPVDEDAASPDSVNKNSKSSAFRNRQMNN